MKKIIFYLIGFIVVSSNAIDAQKVLPGKKLEKANTIKTNNTKITTVPQINSNIVIAPEIRVFERPYYRGRSAPFIKNAQGKFEFPFPLKNVSFKVPNGMIVYIQRCFEFASENAYTSSQPNISLLDICGVRTDELEMVTVSLAGITSEIHTSDCMRVAGKIEATMLEVAPLEPGVVVVLPGKQVQWNNLNYYGYTLPLFIISKIPSQISIGEPNYKERREKANNNPVPQLTEVRHNHSDSLTLRRKRGFPNYSPIAHFYVGKTALREGRIKLSIKTDLFSAHKTCDMCDDFSSNIKMDRPVVEQIPLKKNYDGGKIVDAAHPYIVSGPYTASGIRDGFAITATNGTVKNFRVHLIVEGL